MVHSDLEPGNILFDTSGTARVADFGLARIVRTTSGGRSTVNAGPRGTAGYMAVEVVRGEANPQKPADIYSFGVLMNEVLTGKANLK